jgi:hypothetical protein
MAKALLRTIDRGGGAGKSLEVGDNSDRFGAGGFDLVPDFLDQRGTLASLFLRLRPRRRANASSSLKGTV